MEPKPKDDRLSIKIKLKFVMSFWDAIKIRIAGKKFSDKIIKEVFNIKVEE
jgi:hypothetical protein